jgi:DNA-binding response OmpR family regulator
MNLFDEQTWHVQLEKFTEANPKPWSDETLCVGESVVDCRTGVVQTREHTHRLRRKEVELLAYLHKRGTAVGREELLREVWNCPAMITRTVDQTVATLRRKLSDDPAQPRFLLTVYGVGYQLRKAVPTSRSDAVTSSESAC